MIGIAGLLTLLLADPGARAADDTVVSDVKAAAGKIVQAFNGNNIDGVVAGFIPQGEWIDENGTIYQGQQEIKDVLKAYFAKFPGATMKGNVETVRLVGPIVMEEGTRTTTSKDGKSTAQVRYTAVRIKTDQGWRIASLRDFDAAPPLTPHERLQPLAWLIGEWFNEGGDAAVNISYRWSEDKNFILGDYSIARENRSTTSRQRIGWDAAAGGIRSWLFDADGGFAEGRWTQVDDGWVIKSSSTNPDGGAGTATLVLTPKDANRFAISGKDRIVGETREADFEITITRRPPVAGK